MSFKKKERHYLSTNALQDLSLDLSHPFDHQLVPRSNHQIWKINSESRPELLEVSESSSPEEDKSVPEPVPLPRERVLVHQQISDKQKYLPKEFLSMSA